ncbi:hypothetical protein ROSINTL182_08729 [Roseburia intestinalis L1-82]|uniref:Uncharacterized protein n=1 Tax=Roseburia intestinalis L1-82 TaxID=536231 RepID=C7GFM1_9FIRM|nr:hypothetical protein ROSINTL182_08729 [Roseburia intestinalis L1-82]
MFVHCVIPLSSIIYCAAIVMIYKNKKVLLKYLYILTWRYGKQKGQFV